MRKRSSGGRHSTRALVPVKLSSANIEGVLDQKAFLLRYQDYIEKLMKGEIGVPQLLKELSPDMLVRLGNLALTCKNDKTKLTALQDWLDRAGYGKVEKHAFANVDPALPQEQLISMLEGIGKKTGAIEIED